MKDFEQQVNKLQLQCIVATEDCNDVAIVTYVEVAYADGAPIKVGE